MSLLPLAEAQDRVLALRPPATPVSEPLARSVGRWLAEPLLALRTQPDANLSAMDGYAVRFADLPGPFAQVAAIAAGGTPDVAIGPGQCARIFTGASLPAGADTILMQEDAAEDGGIVRLTGDGPSEEGAFVRAAGSDFIAGAVLAVAGAPVTPALVGLAAMAGHADLPVRRRLTVAILSTGDELIAVGAPCPPGRIPSSNGPMLAALLTGLPVDVLDLGIVPDRMDAMREALDRAATVDILLTIGGASVGDHDLVRPALTQAGASLDFWRVAVRPGKPLLAGTLRGTAVLGLPGNPASAFVTAILFALPLVRAMSGAADPLPRMGRSRLGVDLPANGPRATFLRASMRDGAAVPFADQDSASLRTLSASTHLVVRNAGAPTAAAGDLARTIAIG